MLYLVSLLLCNVAYTGHGLMWLWPSQVEFQRYIILALMVQFTAFGLLFAGRFLELERLRSQWLRPLRLFATAAIGGQLLLIYSDNQHGAALLAFWAVTLFSLLMILLGLSMVRSHPGGRYFLLATLFGGLGAGITCLTVWGLLPYTQLGYHAFEWGVVFEATLLALALARQVRHYQQLSARSSHEARHDLLTGLLNRRGFIAGAQPLWSTANRRQRPLSLLMVDLDHFKAINDHHGHAGGDQALQAVAQLLAEQSREGDLVGRCGGATLTASLGVAGRSANTSLEQLVAEADRQLYQAKEQGRNRVCVSAELHTAGP
ncbi:MAG: diguanylate cyclase [Gammaproteobacteria bacterium]|nr:diguanylate cyclase [Gammaproteobacteria bacterium]